MDVKSAVKLAISYTIDLFESEQISNVGLEEVEFNHSDSTWTVTVGFSRPWDYPKSVLVTIAGGEGTPKRSYKVITIEDSSEEVISIKNRLHDEQ